MVALRDNCRDSKVLKYWVRYCLMSLITIEGLQAQLDQLSSVLGADHSPAEQRELSHRLLQFPLVCSLLQNGPSEMLLLISGADFSGEPLCVNHTVHVSAMQIIYI